MDKCDWQPRSTECLHRSLLSLPSCQIIRLKDVSQETNNTSQSRSTTKNVLWTGTTSKKWLRRSRNGRGRRDYCSGGILISCWGRSNGGERRGSSSGGSRRGRSRRLSSARAVSSRKSDTVLLGTRLRIKTVGAAVRRNETERASRASIRSTRTTCISTTR